MLLHVLCIHLPYKTLSVYLFSNIKTHGSELHGEMLHIILLLDTFNGSYIFIYKTLLLVHLI